MLVVLVCVCLFPLISVVPLLIFLHVKINTREFLIFYILINVWCVDIHVEKLNHTRQKSIIPPPVFCGFGQMQTVELRLAASASPATAVATG